MSKELLESKEIQKFEKRKSDVVSIAESIIVKKKEDLEGARDHIAVANVLLKEIKKDRDDIVPDLNRVHKKAVAFFKRFTDPVESAISIIKKKVSDFQLAERYRIEEANRKAEAKLKQKEEAKRARLQKRAEELENKGRIEEAEAKREEADVYIAPAPEIEAFEKTSKGESGSLTTTFHKKGEVVDGMEIVKAVANGLFPITMIDFNNKGIQTWIDQYNPKPRTIVNGIKIVEFTKDTFRGAK
jgi:hypothetical protein